MKKSLIALLLVVALVVTVSVFAVSAEETNPFAGQEGAVIADCPYCGANQTWYPVLADEYSSSMTSWTNATANGGHFYCADSWTDGSSDTFTTGTWCINLNGKVISRSNNLWFALAGTDAATAPVLNILDTSVEKTGEMDSGSVNGNQFFKATGYGTVNVYSGTISAYGSKRTAGSTSNPTLLEATAESAATFNFYGGTLKGASQYTAGFMRIQGSTVVNIDGATLEGKGGTNTIRVSGSKAKLYLKSGSLTVGSMSSGKDGAIAVMSSGTFEMTGGTLTGNNSSTSAYGGAIRVESGKANLLGGTITATGIEGGAIYVTGSNAKVTLDGATIQNASATKAVGNQLGGGAVLIASSGTFTMKSGTIKDCTATSHGGAVLVKSGTFDMQGGTIENCYAKSTGGAVYISGSNAKILMSGGTITGCHADSSAGAILIQYQSKGSEISGTALIKDCYAPNGGAIALNGSGTPTITIKGGTIQDCYTTKASGAMGGNIYDMSSAGAVINLQGGTITGGKAQDGNGGNIYLNHASSQLNISGGTITKGTALRVAGTSNGNGGNIYLDKGTMTMTGGTISGGLTTNNSAHAGNLYMANGTVVNITGGTITAGRCASFGGNIYNYGGQLTIDAAEGKTVAITNGKAAAGGNIYYRVTADHTDACTTITGPDVTVSGGTAGNHNGTGQNPERAQCGSQIMAYGVTENVAIVELTDVKIDSDEVHTDEIALYEYGQLVVNGDSFIDCAYMTDNTSEVTIQPGFTGDIHVRWLDADISAAVVPGATVDASLWYNEGYTGAGVVKVCNSTRSGKIATINGEGGFFIAGFGGFKFDENGKLVETALAALPTDENAYDFIRSYLDNGATIELNANTTLDLNNGEFDVKTNGFELNLIESRTSEFDYEKGFVTVDDETKVNTQVRLSNGNQYIVLGEKVEGAATKFTAHRVQVDIDSVSIKPATAGIYYTTNMNTTLEASQYAVSYGVVLSLVDMPGADFVNDDSNGDEIMDNLYTEIDFNLAADERVAVKEANSALLVGILNQGAPEGQNKAWGEMPIHANAFVCFNIDGEDYYFMADKTYTLSLLDILMIVDETAPANASVQTMYKTWADPMAIWAEEGKLANIAAAANA